MTPEIFLTTGAPFSVPGFCNTAQPDCYSFIKNCIGYNPCLIGTGSYNGCRTRFASAAWTYVDEASANANNTTGIPVVYSPQNNPGFSIAANHCYSILGVYQNAGNNYVVLRNPWGYSDPTSPALTLGPGPWIYVNRLFDTSGNPTTGSGTVTFDFTLADGIFALEASQFASYFYGFGFVHM